MVGELVGLFVDGLVGGLVVSWFDWLVGWVGGSFIG